MTALAWMVGVGAALLVTGSLLVGPAVRPAVVAGILGPLVSVCLTWVAVAKTHERRPERVTSVMIVGLGLKAVLFGLYVLVMLRLLQLDIPVFLVSFTVAFILLYGLEAMFLRRLLMTGADQASQA